MKKSNCFDIRNAVFALVACLVVVPWTASAPADTTEINERIGLLKKEVHKQQKATAQATKAYVPKIRGQLDDPLAPVPGILRQLPGVVKVEIIGPKKPKQRIVHVLDCHFVPFELYKIDLKDQSKGRLTDQEIKASYEGHLLETELVQLEQMTLLRCLAKHHGLKRILAEGITHQTAFILDVKIGAVAEMQKEMPKVHAKRLEVQKVLKSAKKDSASHKHALKVNSVIDRLLAIHQKSVLEIGAGGRLLLSGDLKEVLPLDDEKLLDAAKPITPDGKIHFDSKKIKARQDAIVKNALEERPVAVIFLGGSHDLRDNVQRLSKGKCQYIRVTTTWAKKISEE